MFKTQMGDVVVAAWIMMLSSGWAPLVFPSCFYFTCRPLVTANVGQLMLGVVACHSYTLDYP